MRINGCQVQRRGAILPMVAICLTALIGMVALAIDIGMVAIAKNQAQNAADSAACATVRTFTGKSGYNLTNAPGAGMTAAGNNTILGAAINASAGSMTKSGADVYVSGPVTLKLGGYYYVYNDSNPAAEAFNLVVPGKDATQPYTAVTANVTTTSPTFFGSIWGATPFNVIANATAAYRPRDIALIMDLSGSMRFESLPAVTAAGTYVTEAGARTISLDPDPNYPTFGHYSSGTASLLGTTSHNSGDVLVTANNMTYSMTGASPPIIADYVSSGTTAAFTAASTAYATTPGGDNYLQSGGSFVKTVQDLLGVSPTLANQLTWSRGGYQGPVSNALAFQTGSAFNKYTAGPSYWGKTFFVWPPDPKGSDLDPSNTANHADNGANDWRQRFFFKVNNSTGALYWLDHNSILFNPNGAPNSTGNPIINRFGSTGKVTTVTENGQSVSYYCMPNYAAIFKWLQTAPVHFPTSMLSGRIQFYSKMPDPSDTTLNNRFWTTHPLSDLSERFWKDYVDFMLGQIETGAGTYLNIGGILGTAPFTAMIGTGDLFAWGTTQSGTKQDCDYVATINNAGGYSAAYSGSIVMNNVATVGGATQTLPGCGSITGATNATPIVITSNNHGLATGNTIYVTGVGGNTAANNAAGQAWTITRLNANTFSLNGSSGSGVYTSGGIWTPTITAATNTSPITVTTSGNHNLKTNQFVYISGINGNTAANGLFQVASVPSATTFTLSNSSGNATGIGGPGAAYTPVYFARFGGTESSGGSNYYGSTFYSVTPTGVGSGTVTASINNPGGSPASATNPALDPNQTSLSTNLGALANSSSVQLYVTVYPYYMSSTDNPYRPKQQLWFGPQTWLDWLGNYSTYCYSKYSSGGTYSLRWAGNTHESQSWSCKVGLNTAIADIQSNHPGDYLGLIYFSNPYDPNQTTYPGFYNSPMVPLGQNYTQMQNSLWFPPSTVTGSATSVTPYDTDFLNTPRAQGGTAPGMALMLAYNMFSSSYSNLRSYINTTTYRGFPGGLGRKGAQRLVIFETDGAPNWSAKASLSGSGADSYYPIRLKVPTNFGDSSNVEWPNTTASYSNTDVYNVVKQICAQTTASPPGYSTTRKPAQVYCIGYGSLFDPANSSLPNQSTALTFLQTVQYYGGTSSDTSGTNFPTKQLIYGSADPNATPNRSTQLQTAIDNILIANTSVSLLQ